MNKRLKYLILIIISIALGLSSRKFPEVLPDLIHEHAGDALWAAMVYFGFRFIFYQKHFLLSGLLALSFSFLIELSQLYQAPWINDIRNTILGALIFGSGFLWVDLLRYTLGIVFAVVMDFVLNKYFVEARPLGNAKL